MTRTFALLSSLALLSMLLSARPLLAQEAPFTGVVQEDNVKARAGAGRTFYIVGDLPKGTKVQVDEMLFGWYKINPPAGVHSYISKAFVDARGDGKSGIVNRDKSPVNAASLDGPGDSYRHQIDLMQGDQVTIVAEEGSFYRIIPPALDGKKRAFVYLPPGSVAREAPPKPTVVDIPPPTPKPSDAAKPKDPAPATTPPAPGVTQDDDTGVTDGNDSATDNAAAPPGPSAADAAHPDTPAKDGAADTAPAVPKVPQIEVPRVNVPPADDTVEVPSPASLQSFEVQTPALRVIEQKMSESLNLPLEKQPIEQLIRAYEAIGQMQDVPDRDRTIIQARLAQLKRNAKLAALLKDIDQAKKIEPDPRPGDDPSADVTLASPRRYDATGQLRASTVYDGQRLPRLLRLVESSTGKTIVYVRPGSKIDSAGMIGRIVGVTGDTRYESSLNVRIIDAKSIDVLEPVRAASAAPEE